MTVFLGHYGSGKTQIALNYALYLRKSRKNVILADLDIVNPYFRTSDGEDVLREHGIRLIASPYANSNLDVPSMPSALQAVFDSADTYPVLDVGGDDRGALALGRYAPKLQNAALWLVINRFRPLTADAGDVRGIMREIENAAHIKINGIVNNSNLGIETTAADVINSRDYAERAADVCGLDIVMTAVWDKLFDEVRDSVIKPFPVKIFPKNAWRL